MQIDAAAHATNHPDKVGASVTRRHEVDEFDYSVCVLERGHKNRRVIDVPACNPGRRFLWRNKPSSMLGAAEQRSKARTRIKPWPAEPVERAGAADESRCLAVADESVVFNLPPRHLRSRLFRKLRFSRLQTRSTKLSTTRFSPALSNWMTSLLPSTATTLPLPNLR